MYIKNRLALDCVMLVCNKKDYDMMHTCSAYVCLLVEAWTFRYVFILLCGFSNAATKSWSHFLSTWNPKFPGYYLPTHISLIYFLFIVSCQLKCTNRLTKLVCFYVKSFNHEARKSKTDCCGELIKLARTGSMSSDVICFHDIHTCTMCMHMLYVSVRV